jgi:hypothetical protein
MFFPQRMMILGEKALKVRLIKAMGATHGEDHKSCSRVFAEKTPIERISVRQNG